MLSGTIPSNLVNCTGLQVFAIQQNEFHGSIPAEIGKLTDLQILQVDHNNLTGHLPPSLGNCTALVILQPGRNELSGPIPSEIGYLQNLYAFTAGGNYLEGSIPQSLGNCSNLQYLDLGVNRLHGVIPVDLGLLNLTHLSLAENFLSGTIPVTLANCTNLLALLLVGNFLADPFPFTFSRLQQLQYLNIGQNQFSQTIPSEIANLTSLFFLDLSYNKIRGHVPKEYFRQLQQLGQLYLSNNLFSGHIPEGLGSCINLIDLDLSFNRFNGSIPSSLSAVSGLQLGLNFSNNYLSGPVPPWLGQMVMVQAIDLSANALSGIIPQTVGSCDALTQLNLSHNALVGEIPGSLGNLVNMEELDLSHNKMAGSLPQQFDRLHTLVSLDLSDNNLTGALPSFLGNVSTRLKSLNVSNNNFSGAIPNSGVFKNLNASSFLGNPELCGPILRKECPAPAVRTYKRHRSLLKKLVVGFSVSTLLLLSVGLLYYFLKWHRRQNSVLFSPQNGLGSQERFTAEELAVATNGYAQENVIGEGGLSVVYKAVMAGGRLVAVKKLKDIGFEKLFLREMQILGKLRHRNLVRILGYVSNLEVKALVLEFMSNGSLEGHLHEGETCELNWEMRLKVAIAVAQGLVYLHHDYGLPIIHGDLKPSNIFMDADLVPRIGDFGIARLISNPDEGGVSLSTTFKGSIGYIAPECAYATKVSTKVDVYSFGILLLELLTRRRPVDATLPSEMTLRQWVQSCLPHNVVEMLDEPLRQSVLSSNSGAAMIERLVRLACACTEGNPRIRPQMRDVVSVLLNIESNGQNVSQQYPTLDDLYHSFL